MLKAATMTGELWGHDRHFQTGVGKYLVSRPGNFTPAPLRTVRQTLASHGAHQTNPSRNFAVWPSYSSTSSCLQLCRTYDCLIRSLRSNPITGPSSLLQTGPSQAIASELSPRGFLPLCFSLGIDDLVPAVPHKSLYRTHAPYTPTAARPVIRLLTGWSQRTRSPLVSTALDR